MKKITIYDTDKHGVQNLQVLIQDDKHYIGWWTEKNEFFVMYEVDVNTVKAI